MLFRFDPLKLCSPHAFVTGYTSNTNANSPVSPLYIEDTNEESIFFPKTIFAYLSGAFELASTMTPLMTCLFDSPVEAVAGAVR